MHGAGLNDEASSVLGWLSIACWVIVYSPQIIENYQLKSGEGLSVAFVIIWLLGDVFNFVGAVMAALLPTVIILGIYYTVCDIILLVQIYYYRATQSSRCGPAETSVGAETTPLLAQREASVQKTRSKYYRVIAYLLALLFVVAVGVAAFVLNRRARGKSHNVRGDGEADIIEWKSQMFGYGSAVLYLASRVPQIIKNRQTHCAGLSLALFMFAVGGNVTYVASILVKSLSRKHLVANASWLIGSGGTVALDLIVLTQFFYYRHARRRDAEDAVIVASAEH